MEGHMGAFNGWHALALIGAAVGAALVNLYWSESWRRERNIKRQYRRQLRRGETPIAHTFRVKGDDEDG
jgi:hypothetical protein